MDLVIEWNNNGVDCLAQYGSKLLLIDEAKMYFAGALEVMRCLALPDFPQSDLFQAMKDNPTFQHALNLDRFPRSYLSSTPFRSTTNDTHRDAPLFNTNIACYSVYSYGMKIHNNIAQYRRRNVIGEMISAILVFNMALTSHLLYLQGPPKIDLITRGLALYSLSLALVKDANMASMVDLSAVLYNNICLIYYDLGQHELAMGIIMHDLPVAIEMISHVIDTTKVTSIKEGELEELYINTVLHETMICASAA